MNQETKSAVLENYELEYRKEPKTDRSSLALSNYQNSTASKKIESFLKLECLCRLCLVNWDLDEKSFGGSYGTQNEFVSPDESKLLAHFVKFGFSEQ